MKPIWNNRTLFHGDNLDFMRTMNSGSVDLIATDPPFNKGRDFHATPDSLAAGAKFHDRWSWEQDVHQDWIDQITDDHPNVMNVVQGSRSSYGDDGDTVAPFLRVKVRIKEPEDKKMSRKEMYEHLLDQHGMRCQGCYRTFDDPRYLQLDHNTPRSDGGLNHISNRILLCGPCNKLKSNQYTLSGLRRQNRRNGYMVNV